MKSLLDIYHRNVDQRPLFSEIKDIDFYDGPTEALCRLIDTDQWIICSLVFIDFEMDERIFTLLEISADALFKFQSIFEGRHQDQQHFYPKLKAQVKAVYGNYAGKAFLFKSGWLKSVEYEITEIHINDLQYFVDIEAVIGQSEKSKTKWKTFFAYK